MSNGRTLGSHDPATSLPLGPPERSLTPPPAQFDPPGRSSPRWRGLTVAAALAGCVGVAQMLSCGAIGGRPSGDQTLDDEDPNMPHLVSLTLKPNNDVLLVDLNTEATKQFSVRGLYSDGSSTDFSRKVKFTVDNSAVGTFAGPTFKSANLATNKVDFTKVFAKFNYNGRDLATVANLTIVWLRTTGN